MISKMPSVLMRRSATNQYFCLRPAACQSANPFQIRVQMIASPIQIGPTPKIDDNWAMDSMARIILYLRDEINGYRLWHEESGYCLDR